MKFFDIGEYSYQEQHIEIKFGLFCKTQTAMSGLRHFSPIFMSKISPFGESPWPHLLCCRPLAID